MTPQPGEVPAAPTPPDDPGPDAPVSGTAAAAASGRAARERRRRAPALASMLAEVGDLAAPVAAPAPAGPADAEPHATTPPAADPDPPGRIVPSGAVRRLRRRRSASALPPLPRPTDLPDDVAGRVEFITVETVVLDGAGDAGGAAPAGEPLGAADPSAAPAGVMGWVPLLVLGALLVAVFVIGLLATR